MDENTERDQMRKTKELDAKMAEQSQDQQELAWTNATLLERSDEDVYSKYMK